MVLECGAAKINIKPPTNIGDLYIAGYMAMEAPKIKGVHDPIFCRAIILNDGKQKIALVSVECIGLLADFIDVVKKRLEAYDFEKHQIFIFATHTHAAPDTMGLWGPLIGISGINKKYMNFLSDSIEKAVIEASSNLKPSEIFLSQTKVEGLIENYRDAREVNSKLKILKILSDGKVIASLWTYSAQPEITDRENISISGDYPGLVSDMIEKEFGGVSAFALGLCGAQSPIYCEAGNEKMEEFASRIFSAIKQVFTEGKKIENTPIELRERKIKLKIENEDFLLLFQLGIFTRDLDENSAYTTLSKVRIGNLHLIHIPGEPFPSLFSKIINDHPDKELMFISQSNDSVGYFIPLDQFKLKTKQFIDEKNQEKFIGHELESLGWEAAEVIKKSVKDILKYRTVMAIGAHADDLTIWSGGTLRKLTSEGNKLICVRVTDDYGDATGISKEKAIKRNRREVEKAYKILGAEEIIHMDYPTDTLAGCDYLEFRGKLVELMRTYKPDLVVSFDLNGIDEENMDHIITARAVNEACWQASFDLFYIEQLDKGLEIHAVAERWLFARNPTVLNFHVNITPFIDDKIKAISQQKTVMENFFRQNLLLARANDLYIELLEEEVPNPIRVHLLVKLVYGDIGEKYGIPFAEEFNRIGAGFLEEMAEE